MRAKSRKKLKFTFGECIAFVNVKPCIWVKALGRKKMCKVLKKHLGIIIAR
jgi:hypothetical protein